MLRLCKGGVLGLAEEPWEGLPRKEASAQMSMTQGFVSDCSGLTGRSPGASPIALSLPWVTGSW